MQIHVKIVECSWNSVPFDFWTHNRFPFKPEHGNRSNDKFNYSSTAVDLTFLSHYCLALTSPPFLQWNHGPAHQRKKSECAMEDMVWNYVIHKSWGSWGLVNEMDASANWTGQFDEHTPATGWTVIAGIHTRNNRTELWSCRTDE